MMVAICPGRVSNPPSMNGIVYCIRFCISLILEPSLINFPKADEGSNQLVPA